MWTTIRRRCGKVIGGGGVLAFGGGGGWVIRRLRAPGLVVPENPDRTAPPPPPPPRPLQSEAEGYYEPSYKFTVSDRRFTRLTLRPQPFVTFARTGTDRKSTRLNSSH